MKISERIKCPQPKKDAKDRSADGPISRKQGSSNKAPSGASIYSRILFEQLIDRRLVSEFVKGPESGVRIDLVGSENLMISAHCNMRSFCCIREGLQRACSVFII